MERQTFEIKVNGKPVLLELGKCAVALFRTKQEVDYVAIDTVDEDGEPALIRLFNNVDFARWVAGYAIEEVEGVLERTPVFNDEDDLTFRETVGWNPSVIEKDEPFDWEEEMWVELNTRDLEKGLNELT